MDRRKVLALSFNDIRQSGHAYSILRELDASKYETRLIVKYSEYGSDVDAFYSKQSLQYFLYRYFFKRLFAFFRRFSIKDNKYAFCKNDVAYSSAKQILEKYDDTPDLIFLFTTEGFLSNRVIRDLYKKTNAKIVFIFVDQFFLGSGCHYSCECKGFCGVCDECPAFGKTWQDILKKRKIEKNRYFDEIEKIVVATPYDIKKAKKSRLFKDALFIDTLSMNDNLKKYPKSECREKWGIPNDSMVVMFGASSTKNERKGYSHFIRAVQNLAKTQVGKKPFVVLLAGFVSEEDIKPLNDVKVIITGYLNLDDLSKAFQASDVFVSTSLDDSGPKMVNFSVELNIPVVSYPVGVAVSLIEHKVNGYLATYGSPQDIANGLSYILYDDKFNREESTRKCTEVTDFYCNKESWHERLFRINM